MDVRPGGDSWGLAWLVDHLVSQGLRRVAVLTSAPTGNPALAGMDLRGPDLLVSFQYSDPAIVIDGRTGPPTLEPVLEQIAGLGLSGRLDLVVTDPFHTEESSRRCLDAAFDLVRPGGLVLVHDCLPPPELASAELLPHDWCGVTYAAFARACRARGVDWVTLNADFGIGVAVGPSDSDPTPATDDVPLADLERAYRQDPFALLRAVDRTDALEAVDRLLTGCTVDDLLADFAGWDTALDLTPPPMPTTPEQAAELRTGLAAAMDRAEDLERARFALHVERDEAIRRAAAADLAREQAEAALATTQAALDGVTSSVSWRVTGPLRAAKRVVQHPR